jgi:hypothetical protein
VGHNDDGTTELFVIGQDFNVWHTKADLYGGHGEWQNLGAPPLSPGPDPDWGTAFGDPNIKIFRLRLLSSVTQSHLMQLLAVGPDGDLWLISQVQENENIWSSWLPLGGEDIALAVMEINFEGMLEVFALTRGGLVWHRRQIGGNWTDWS